MTPEEQRLLIGDLTDAERVIHRKSEEWETCFQAWLDCETPSVIREWMEGPERELLLMLDSKAHKLVKAVAFGESEVEAMQRIFEYPEDWEDTEDEFLPPDLRAKADALLKRVQG